MTVTEISYSRLVSFGSYENATFAATARLAPDEDLHVAAGALKTFVEGQADEVRRSKDKWRQVQTDIHDAEHRLSQVNRELTDANEKYERVVTLLRKFDIELTDPAVPF